MNRRTSGEGREATGGSTFDLAVGRAEAGGLFADIEASRAALLEGSLISVSSNAEVGMRDERFSRSILHSVDGAFDVGVDLSVAFGMDAPRSLSDYG